MSFLDDGGGDDDVEEPSPKRPHTPYDYGYNFLTRAAHYTLEELLEGAETEPLKGPWLTPRPSSTPHGISPRRRPSTAPVADPWLDKKPELPLLKFPKNSMEEHILHLREKQDTRKAPETEGAKSQDIVLTNIGNWPFADKARVLEALKKAWMLAEARRLRRERQAAEEAERRRRMLADMARMSQMYLDWLKSKTFEHEYDQYRLKVPKRLTKKELLKLRELVYKITTKRILRKFSELMKAFYVPTEEDQIQDIDCLSNLNSYHDYKLPASQLFAALREDVGLTELEASVILELKLGVPVHTVLAIADWVKDKKRAPLPPDDPLVAFDDFCSQGLPDMTEVQDIVARVQRTRERWVYQQKEREKKMGAVWERIKRRRMETKVDMDVAFLMVQQHTLEVDERVRSILRKVINAGSKGWEPGLRRKFATKLRTHIVLIDIKPTLCRCVMEGVNLGGLKPAEIARVVQNLCAVKMQAAFRCFARYKKYSGALKMCKRRMERLRMKVFHAFKECAQLQANIKKYCRRPVYKWRQWTKRRKELFEYFRQTFWPFHVWWRYTIKRLRARDKSRFLAGVWRMYLKLRVFRALRRFSDYLIEAKQEIRPLQLRHGRDTWKEVFRCWHLYARRRQRLRVSWEAGGQALRQTVLARVLNDTFALWRYTAYTSAETKRRGPQYFRSGYMDLVQHIDSKRKKREAENKALSRANKALSPKNAPPKVHAQEKKRDWLSKPLVLSISKTAWDTERMPHTKPPSLMPPLLYLSETKWRTDVPRVNDGAKSVHQHYCLKDRRGVATCFLMYKRVGPVVMQALRKWVVKKRKRRYAMIHASLALEKRVLRGWRDAVTAIREEERRKAEQAAEDAAKKQKNHWEELTALEKDVATRRIEQLKALDMGDYTLATVKKQQEKTRAFAQDLTEFDGGRKKLEASVTQIVQREGERTKKSDGVALDWAKNFRTHAVESLVNALVRMNESVRRYQNLNKVRKTFRVLRLLYIEGKVQHMFNYYLLRRHLRICARYRYLLRGMPLYRDMRTKWTTWNKWLSFIEFMYTMRTKGMSKQYQRRRDLYLGFNSLLELQPLIPIHYTHMFLNPIITTRKAVFLRWVYYTQRRVAFRTLKDNARKLHQHRFLRRVVWAWRTGADLADTYLVRKRGTQRHGQQRLLADIGVVRSCFVAADRVSLVRKIRMRNREWARRMISADTAPSSFKKALADYQHELDERLLLERSLLFDAFQERGTMEFEDHLSRKVLGKDRDREIGAPFESEKLPGSYLLSDITVYYKGSRGIVGIAVTVIPGEYPKQVYTLPLLGHLGTNSESFVVQPYERVVQVEVMVGIVLEQIRFKTNKGRLSRWMGKQINHALAVKQDISVGGPSESIIGFHGMADSIRLQTIGIKIRIVKRENIFTYNWVESQADPVHIKLKGTEWHEDDDTEEDQSLSAPEVPGMGSPDQEFIVLMAMRSVDLKEAQTRGLAFARRLWDHKAIDKKLEPLCRPLIIMRLLRWFQQTITKELPAMPERRVEAESIKLQGRTMKLEGMALPQRAVEIRELAHRMQQAPRPWRTSGMISPQERAKEVEYQEHIQRLNTEAMDVETQARDMVKRGEALMAQARTILPSLPVSDSTRAYYRRLVQLVKSQTELHKVFKGDAFKRAVYHGHQDQMAVRVPGQESFNALLEGAVAARARTGSLS